MYSVPDGREWTVGLASELLNLRSSELEVEGFSFEELDENAHMCVQKLETFTNNLVPSYHVVYE